QPRDPAAGDDDVAWLAPRCGRVTSTADRQEGPQRHPADHELERREHGIESDALVERVLGEEERRGLAAYEEEVDVHEDRGTAGRDRPEQHPRSRLAMHRLPAK